jgi:predicted N-acetyltransferase YhbS
VEIRPAARADAEACGRICYEAFRGIAEAHGFPPDFPSPELATGVISFLIDHPEIYGAVAELDGRVVGSNFMDERSTISGIGPITVDASAQNARVGRALMLDALARAGERGAPGVRLVQAAYHTRSLALYAALGFEVKEPLVTLQGPRLRERVPGFEVRRGTPDDLEQCNAVCLLVHGHDRSGEVRDAAAEGTLRVVEHDGRPVGYATGLAFFAHAVAETNDGLKALIADAEAFGGPGFLLPSRNAELLRWCLARGLRIVQLMTLMASGLYNEPAGAWLPSVSY